MAKFTIAGQMLWLIMTAYICSFLGAFQVPVFCCIVSYAIAGIGYDMKNRCNFGSTNESISNSITNLLDVKTFYFKKTSKPSSMEQIAKSKEQLNIKELEMNKSNIYTPNFNNDETNETFESDTYFVILFYGCAGTIFYQNTWLLFFLTIPIAIYFINKFCKAFGVHTFLIDKSISIYNLISVSHINFIIFILYYF